MKLHLGCGAKHMDGYINIDAREMDGVDVIDNIKTLSRYEENTIDLIYVSHVLEHIGRLEYPAVLKRWYSLLKSGGIIRIGVPDMEQVFKHYSIHNNLGLLRGFLWGGQTYKENYHYVGWDFRTLKQDLKNVGFTEVKRFDWKNVEFSHLDDFTQSYLPHMDKENGMLMSLNVEAIK